MPDRFYTQTFLPAMTIAGAVHSDIFGRESQVELFFAFRLKSIAGSFHSLAVILLFFPAWLVNLEIIKTSEANGCCTKDPDKGVLEWCLYWLLRCFLFSLPFLGRLRFGLRDHNRRCGLLLFFLRIFQEFCKIILINQGKHVNILRGIGMINYQIEGVVIFGMNCEKVLAVRAFDLIPEISISGSCKPGLSGRIVVSVSFVFIIIPVPGIEKAIEACVSFPFKRPPPIQ